MTTTNKHKPYTKKKPTTKVERIFCFLSNIATFTSLRRVNAMNGGFHRCVMILFSKLVMFDNHIGIHVWPHLYKLRNYNSTYINGFWILVFIRIILRYGLAIETCIIKYLYWHFVTGLSINSFGILLAVCLFAWFFIFSLFSLSHSLRFPYLFFMFS